MQLITAITVTASIIYKLSLHMYIFYKEEYIFTTFALMEIELDLQTVSKIFGPLNFIEKVSKESTIIIKLEITKRVCTSFIKKFVDCLHKIKTASYKVQQLNYELFSKHHIVRLHNRL